MRLLLHICCAPCLVYVHDKLTADEIQYEGFFYNPNIHPYLEYKRRLRTLQEFTKGEGVLLTVRDSFLQPLWENDSEMCKFCYMLRLFETARYAKQNGFTHFSTTLLVSPYQNHEMIVEAAKAAEKEYGVIFHYEDFRQGYRKGQEKARQQNLYRQKYCGCIQSYHRSAIKDKITW
ncbi:MAG: epoxyqueuosine reductase QueH [Clostridia bacterium]